MPSRVQEAPRPATWLDTALEDRRYTATWLAVLFGPLGLAYISARASLVGFVALLLAGATGASFLLVLVWIGCIGAARAGARGYRLGDIAVLGVRDVL